MTTTTERNRKSPADYLASEMTENQKEFLAYVLQAATEAGLAPQSAPEIRFFEIGVKGAGLYARSQAANEPEPVAAPKRVTRRRATEAA